MDLSQLGRGGGKYNRLAPGNVVSLGAAVGWANFGNNITVSNVNISAALTEMISVPVPIGEIYVLKSAGIGLLNTTSNALSMELEVDGVVVLTGSQASHSDSGATFVGQPSTLTQSPSSGLVSDIEVRSNFKIRARKSLSTAASITVNFAKMKA